MRSCLHDVFLSQISRTLRSDQEIEISLLNIGSRSTSESQKKGAATNDAFDLYPCDHFGQQQCFTTELFCPIFSKGVDQIRGVLVRGVYSKLV